MRVLWQGFVVLMLLVAFGCRYPTGPFATRTTISIVNITGLDDVSVQQTYAGKTNVLSITNGQTGQFYWAYIGEYSNGVAQTILTLPGGALLEDSQSWQVGDYERVIKCSVYLDWGAIPRLRLDCVG